MEPGESLVGNAYKVGRKLAEHDRLIIAGMFSLALFLGMLAIGWQMSNAMIANASCVGEIKRAMYQFNNL